MGVLCATREATKGVRDAVKRLGRPVMWIMLEDVGEGQGRIRQVLWNQRVAEIGAQGVDVQTRYSPTEEGNELDQEAVLTWDGKIWEPDLEDEIE